MTRRRSFLFAFATLAAACLSIPAPAMAGERWSVEKANAWYAHQRWPIGCNYIPSTAINQLEMWQAETFDIPTIDRELGWAEGLGFTTVRVFLHDLMWKKDQTLFLRRIERFLAVAERHQIKVMFVLFDSCWDPSPALGKQRDPKPGLHNSGWVQSPGTASLKDPAALDALKGYVQGVVNHFQADDRVLAWDLFNEPDNDNRSSYGKLEPADKIDLSLNLLRKSFDWAREVNPTQPLTSGAWVGDWSPEKASPTARLQFDESDIISFHNYGKLPELKERVAVLRKLGRPLLCTEYMARPAGSTFDPNLAYLREQGIGAYNWGFVDGKSQTIYPWDSWKKPYDAEPPVWFHDIFRKDGTPYDPKEVAYIRQLTGKAGP
jgi:Cellulase (glycosyl hydrolase family 5)